MSNTDTVLSFLRDKLCEFINKLTLADYNTLRAWHHKAADLIEAQQARVAELEADATTYALKDQANFELRQQRDKLLAALQKIAESDPGEGGCYYTNKANIHTARSAVSIAKAGL